jgi:hypothetical protein
MHPKSKQGKRAIKLGLNPNTTSIFSLCCAENNLKPENSSFIDLAAAKLGKTQISINDAKKAFGQNQVREICK